jgi:hypothetical protein
MNQEKLNEAHEEQVLYDGRWVNKKSFRAFVYSENEQKLVKSYDEYRNALTSGLWFESRQSFIENTQISDIKVEVLQKNVENEFKKPILVTLGGENRAPKKISEFKPKPKAKANSEV